MAARPIGELAAGPVADYLISCGRKLFFCCSGWPAAEDECRKLLPALRSAATRYGRICALEAVELWAEEVGRGRAHRQTLSDKRLV